MEKPRHPLALYKPDVSLGNILTLIGMLMTVVVWGLRLEGRVDAQYQVFTLQQQAYNLRFQYLETSLGQQRQDTKEALQEIRGSLKRIEESLNGKADKAK